MTRTTLVAGTAALAVVAFGGAAWLTTRPEPAALAAPAEGAAEVAPSTPATPATPAADPADEAAPQAAAAGPDYLVRPYSPVLGPADAPVTIVEFFDPSCEACRAFHPVLQQIRDTYPTQVRVVLRYAAFHEGSDEAVRILEAARRQDLFEPVLDALLEAQPRWATHDGPRLDLAWEAAGGAGLDLERAVADRLFPGTTAVLNQDAADVEAAGVEQTPTFFVNGEPLAEFGADELVEAVRLEVEATD